MGVYFLHGGAVVLDRVFNWSIVELVSRLVQTYDRIYAWTCESSDNEAVVASRPPVGFCDFLRSF